jgi:hypothetical protein
VYTNSAAKRCVRSDHLEILAHGFAAFHNLIRIFVHEVLFDFTEYTRISLYIYEEVWLKDVRCLECRAGFLHEIHVETREVESALDILQSRLTHVEHVRWLVIRWRRSQSSESELCVEVVLLELLGLAVAGSLASRRTRRARGRGGQVRSATTAAARGLRTHILRALETTGHEGSDPETRAERGRGVELATQRAKRAACQRSTRVHSGTNGVHTRARHHATSYASCAHRHRATTTSSKRAMMSCIRC